MTIDLHKELTKLGFVKGERNIVLDIEYWYHKLSDITVSHYIEKKEYHIWRVYGNELGELITEFNHIRKTAKGTLTLVKELLKEERNENRNHRYNRKIRAF